MLKSQQFLIQVQNPQKCYQIAGKSLGTGCAPRQLLIGFWRVLQVTRSMHAYWRNQQGSLGLWTDDRGPSSGYHNLSTSPVSTLWGRYRPMGRHALTCKRSGRRHCRQAALDVTQRALSAAHVQSRLEPTGPVGVMPGCLSYTILLLLLGGEKLLPVSTSCIESLQGCCWRE